MVSAHHPAGPLDGVVVADFSRVLSGPYATMVLGDLGADVIRIERPGVGDETRRWGPPFVGSDAAYFHAVNRNKRSIALDLRNPADLAVARRVVSGADLLVENFRPGTMERLGLGYTELASDHPGLVYCSISGFGTGAGADLPGYDLVTQAMSGLMDVTGPEGRGGFKVGVAVTDVLAGLHLAVGALAALYDRASTGRGQHVEVDLFSTALASLVNLASTYLNGGGVPVAHGNRHPTIVPYESFPTADGELVVGVGNDAQFAALCGVLGLDHLVAEPDYVDNPARVAHREALVARLGERFTERPTAAWVDDLRRAGVPCGPVNTIADAFAVAQALGLDPVVPMARDDGPSIQVRSPLRLSRTPVSYRLPPPHLGSDTDVPAPAAVPGGEVGEG